jgi:hypothetical protein
MSGVSGAGHAPGTPGVSDVDIGAPSESLVRVGPRAEAAATRGAARTVLDPAAPAARSLTARRRRGRRPPTATGRSARGAMAPPYPAASPPPHRCRASPARRGAPAPGRVVQHGQLRLTQRLQLGELLLPQVDVEPLHQDAGGRVVDLPQAGHHRPRPGRLEGALQAQHPLAALQRPRPVSQAERTTSSVPRRSSACTSSAVRMPSSLPGRRRRRRPAPRPGRVRHRPGRRPSAAAASARRRGRPRVPWRPGGERRAGPRGGRRRGGRRPAAGDSKKPWVPRCTTRTRPPSSRRLTSPSVGSPRSAGGRLAGEGRAEQVAGQPGLGSGPGQGAEAGPLLGDDEGCGGDRGPVGRGGPTRVGPEGDVADGQEAAAGWPRRSARAATAWRPEAT